MAGNPAWVKGRSGNPAGRMLGGQAEKQFYEALRIVANRSDPDGKKKLMKIAETLVDKAIEGEGWAVCQVADRLDGKPAQESTVNINNRSLTELADEEIATRIEQLRAGRAGTVRRDDETSLDSPQFN
jgi:hypothetical protein